MDDTGVYLNFLLFKCGESDGILLTRRCQGVVSGPLSRSSVWKPVSRRAYVFTNCCFPRPLTLIGSMGSATFPGPTPVELHTTVGLSVGCAWDRIRRHTWCRLAIGSGPCGMESFCGRGRCRYLLCFLPHPWIEHTKGRGQSLPKCPGLKQFTQSFLLCTKASRSLTLSALNVLHWWR